jgi:hypothetical protein
MDGLESGELIDLIVEELAQEFPDYQHADIAALVRERRAKIARPSTGGALFLEAQKFLSLEHAQLATLAQ